MNLIFQRSFYLFLLFSINIDLPGQSTCSDPGAILTGSSTALDVNSDGYFSNYSSSGFTLSRNEYTEFEVLTSAGGADVDWTPLAGNDPSNDL